MRTRAVLTSAFASIGILTIGWQAGASVIASTTAASTSSTGTATTIPSTGSSSSSSSTTSTTSTDSTSSAAPAASTVADGTYTGAAASTRWGDVQVSVTISGGAITEVTALQLTNADGKSVQISNRAAPILRDEVLAAQSASVSTVSGGTYTSLAYLSSVQSALDQAGF